MGDSQVSHNLEWNRKHKWFILQRHSGISPQKKTKNKNEGTFHTAAWSLQPALIKEIVLFEPRACTCSSAFLTTRIKCAPAERRPDSSLTGKQKLKGMLQQLRITAFCHWILGLWSWRGAKRSSSLHTTHIGSELKNLDESREIKEAKKIWHKKKKINILTTQPPLDLMGTQHPSEKLLT